MTVGAAGRTGAGTPGHAAVTRSVAAMHVPVPEAGRAHRWLKRRARHMKIKIRPDDATTLQADDWLQMNDWLGALREHKRAAPPPRRPPPAPPPPHPRPSPPPRPPPPPPPPRPPPPAPPAGPAPSAPPAWPATS